MMYNDDTVMLVLNQDEFRSSAPGLDHSGLSAVSRPRVATLHLLCLTSGHSCTALLLQALLTLAVLKTVSQRIRVTRISEYVSCRAVDKFILA